MVIMAELLPAVLVFDQTAAGDGDQAGGRGGGGREARGGEKFSFTVVFFVANANRRQY